MSVLQPLDWVVIFGYFVVIAGICVWVAKRQKKTSDGYFLAGRELGWFVIGASIFASNIGSEHLVGLAASGATDGVAMAHYELHAWCLLILAWVMVPFYMRSKVFTMPEFLERRFSPAARTVLSVISLVAYVLTKIAVGIFAGGVVFSVLIPELSLWGLDSFWVGSLVVVVITGLYTIVGGMRAVAYTEAIQTIVLVIGSALVTFFGLQALGGWSELRAIVPSDMFNLWKPLVPDGLQSTWAPVRDSQQMAWYFNDNYPWLGMLVCAPAIGLWYWCTDQYIVQRALTAGLDRGRVLQAASRVHIHHSRNHLLRSRPFRQSPLFPADHDRCRRQYHPGQRPAGVSPDGIAGTSDRGAGNRRRRPAGRIDELAGRSIQRQRHALHHRLLRTAAPRCVAGETGMGRSRCHRCHGPHRHILDPCDQGRPRTL